MAWTKRLLWLIYLSLLAVLLPHTAWAFGMFEPSGWVALGWIGALAFEGAVGALTWRLTQVIEATTNYRSFGKRWRARYLNTYSAGLLVSIGVSSAANWAHAVQFGRAFAVFGDYAVPPLLYSLAFGGILPVCSLLFAHILADTQASVEEANPELEAAKAESRELRREVRQAEAGRTAAEERAADAERRFAAAGDLFALLFAEEKRQRIVAARQTWSRLPASAIAIMTDTSPSYVSEVLKFNLIEEGPDGEPEVFARKPGDPAPGMDLSQPGAATQGL